MFRGPVVATQHAGCYAFATQAISASEPSCPSIPAHTAPVVPHMPREDYREGVADAAETLEERRVGEVDFLKFSTTWLVALKLKPLRAVYSPRNRQRSVAASHEWSGRVRSSISVSRRGKVSLDVGIFTHSYRPFFRETVRPCDGRVAKATVENEKLAALFQRVPRLHQCSRRLAGLDDDRSLRQRRHGDVAFRKEDAVLFGTLALPAFDRHLRNQKEILSDALLQIAVLGRIGVIEGGADHGNGMPAVFDRRLMRYAVNALRKPRYDREAVLHQRPDQLLCALLALGAGGARSDHGNAA